MTNLAPQPLFPPPPASALTPPPPPEVEVKMGRDRDNQVNEKIGEIKRLLVHPPWAKA